MGANRVAILAVVVFLIAGCSGESSDPKSFTIGGTVSGLSGPVVLLNNGGDELLLASDGSFTFDGHLSGGQDYAVTVAIHPAGETCTVNDGTGRVGAANVTNVSVVCAASAYSVGGTVTGLEGYLVLLNNGGDALWMEAGGEFTFDEPVADGAGYDVTVALTDDEMVCEVRNGSGTIAGADVADVAVRCAPFMQRVSVASDGTQGNGFSGWPEISADGRYVTFASQATNLVAGDANGVQDIFIHDLVTKETTRVSVASNGSEANGDSWFPSISADGRHVTFMSFASDLVALDTNGFPDVFVHDRSTGETTLVSVASDGTHGDSASALPSISADGRFVAFISAATNFAPGDYSVDRFDVFVHDRSTGETTRVSVDGNGAQSNAPCMSPSISADGRYVTFSSFASNLVADDTNGFLDIFVHDRSTGDTTRVSVDNDGAEGNGDSTMSFVVDETDAVAPTISPDGRYVVFSSQASNLVGADANGAPDAFIHDRTTGETRLVSLDSNGNQGSSSSGEPVVSADGRFILFQSYADNLVADDTNGRSDLFLHELTTGETTRVSLTRSGVQGDDHSAWGSISANGDVMAFNSSATNLVAGDTNGVGDVFVRRR